MPSLAVLSMHTSPLVQPGRGDSGGMNVYVRQLCSALARRGARCDIYTRAWAPDLAAVVDVEPGLRVHHVVAGPLAEVPKAQLPALVDEFTSAVVDRMERGHQAGAVHANYWLSGMVGHALKHRLGLPLLSTFHTLARVKAADALERGDEDLERRAEAEAEIMSCTDALLASSPAEVGEIADRYGVDAARIEVVPPGVDHAFFSPGDRGQARRALGLDAVAPVVLFVGRIQPLKGADVAVRALAHLGHHHGDRDGGRGCPSLVVVGGPSGPRGEAEVARLGHLVEELRLVRRVRFVAPQPHELLSTYYRAADVCLVPSRSESFGLVALEAAACGTPVVASAVGGLRSLVDHGSTGFLVEGRDPRAFAACIERVLDDPARAAEWSLNAVARARPYKWSAAAARLQRLCSELTDRALVQC